MQTCRVAISLEGLVWYSIHWGVHDHITSRVLSQVVTFKLGLWGGILGSEASAPRRVHGDKVGQADKVLPSYGPNDTSTIRQLRGWG